MIAQTPSRSPRLASVVTLGVALAISLLAPQTPAQEARPYEISPELTLPAVSPDRRRLVPPRPRVTITGDEDDEGERGSRSRYRPRERRSSTERILSGDAQEAVRSMRERQSSRPPTQERPTSDPSFDRSSRPRTSNSDDVSSMRSVGTYRRAPGPQANPDDPATYGRLIVITDDNTVTIDGEPYPRGSMSGVLLWAGFQYEVLIEAPESEGGGGSSSSSRVVTVRLRPDETRILMANLGDQAGSVSRSSSDRSNRDRRRARRGGRDEEEEENIGYLGVSSTPRGSVYIDGDNTGQTTPARRIELEPGRHEVRIFYDSEERFSETKNVLIRAGVNTNVFFRMRREAEDDDDAEDAD